MSPKKVIMSIIMIIIILATLSTAYSNEKTNSSKNEINLSLGLGSQIVGIETNRASFSFFAPILSIESNLNQKFRIHFDYSYGEDSVKVGNTNTDYNLKWKELNISMNYKILNEDKSLWSSLLYKQFEMNSSWENEVDKDTWRGIGIGLNYNTKLRENIKGILSLNYFPYLSSGIGDYKNVEIKGQIEYEMKNKKNSIILYYNNQNLSSLIDNIGDIKVNQVGIKFKAKLN